jgi:uncharacterized zinc-type alcohol dehydrogenase-like protein
VTNTASSFDLIVDTVPVRHDIFPYMPLLDVDGTLVIMGHLGMQHSTCSSAPR